MPTPANAFDFEDNPSASDDELARIPRRVSTQNTVALILEDTMTGNTMADKLARIKRTTARNETMAQANADQAPNPEDKRKKQNDFKQKEEREARVQKRDDVSAMKDLADHFALSCPDDVLYNRLMSKNPGGAAHGPWDGNMIQQEVDPDGNCFIHAALRCSDCDPAEDTDGPEYKAKVLQLRKDVHAYLVLHEAGVLWTNKCDKLIHRGVGDKVNVDTYSKYCELMAKDGTYMGDLEIQAFSNMCNITFQVATDKILHDDNAVGLSTGGLSTVFSPYHIVGDRIIDSQCLSSCGHLSHPASRRWTLRGMHTL